ncbi:putative bifunctional diguanylate cyclase/phosphodiesterase [Polycladidibacter hongkongensis]|uniref:putative bifunctional diguanylate cyclase/phosphodiesterase n=1 Tax=Polycladidibacter hongkongensis TaxID=1647556 RepID=UPI00155E8911|nr:EAL domain-containing protein [Pseudovibrio hongkongensis]
MTFDRLSSADTRIGSLPAADAHAFQRIGHPIAILDPDCHLIAWANHAACNLMELPPSKRLRDDNGRDFAAALPLPEPFNAPRYTRHLHVIRADQTGRDVSSTMLSAKLGERMMNLSVAFSCQPFEDGRMGVVASLLSTGNKNELQMRSTQALFHTTTHIALFSKSGELLYENPAFRLSRPYDGDRLSKIFCRHEDCNALHMAAAENEEKSLLAQLHTKDGPRWFDISVRPDLDTATGKPVYLLSANDVTTRIEAEREIRYIAHHDQLTGLANRNVLATEVDRLLQDEARQQIGGSLLFIDLDHFKTINDTLGHQTGDDLLVLVANRLKKAAGEHGLVARHGGDEFVILCHAITDQATAILLAEEICTAIAEPCQIGEHRLHVSPSIGITLFPEHGRDFPTLLRKADLAMYRAKEQGRNRTVVFEPAMQIAADERLSVSTLLRSALDLSELQLHYQPRLCALTHRIVGVEALLRWHHPSRGYISPAGFIGIAEENGLIDEIGNWVALNAMQQQARWAASGFNLDVSFNLSPAQLRRGGLPQRFAKLLRETGVRPEKIHIEITENTLINDSEDSLRDLFLLNDLGFPLEIDDFGTGYSNLAYLHRYPVSSLKIDRSFISDSMRWPIVRMITQMGQFLGLNLVAEGIETEAQLNHLRQLGCHQFQGFLFSPAVPAAKICEMLEAQQQSQLHFTLPAKPGEPQKRIKISR